MKVTDIWFSRLRLQHFGFWHEGLTLKLLGWLNPKHKQSHAGDTEGSQETGPLKSHKFLCPWATIRNHGGPIQPNRACCPQALPGLSNDQMGLKPYTGVLPVPPSSVVYVTLSAGGCSLSCVLADVTREASSLQAMR